MLTTIIHCTDSHVSASTPDRPSPRRWRRGTYEDDVMAKLDWVTQRAVQLQKANEGTVLVWHTGDIFDRAVEPLRVTLRVADWARQLGDYNIPLLGTLGQHDIRAYNLASAVECSVGVLYRLGDDAPHLMTGVQGENGRYNDVTCASLHVGADNLLTTDDPEILHGVDVVGTHLSIHHNSFGCVHPRDIHWPVKLVLCAHIHAGMPIAQYNGTTYSAPGALVRLNADEVERQPQISIIRIDEKTGEVASIEYETVPHKKAVDVFDLQAMDESAIVEQQRTEFRQAIDTVQQQQAAVGDWRTQVENARTQVGDDVTARLTTYCEKAEGQ